MQNNYQPQPPINTTNPIQLMLSKTQNRTRFLCWIQIFLKAIFLLFLFLDGMFNLEYHKSHDDYVLSQSFSTVTTEDCYIPVTDWYLRNEFCHVLFYIIIVVIAADLVLSMLRAIKPEYTKKWKWQLALPAFIFVAVITSVIISSSYCDTGKMISFYDSSTGHTSYYNKADISGYTFTVMHGDYLKEFYGSISIDFLFYITLLLGLVILAIDFYTMFMSKQESFNSSNISLKEKFSNIPSFFSKLSVKETAFCPTCGKHYKGESVFCNTCGTKLTKLEPKPTTVKCPACGKESNTSLAFCDICGNRLTPAEPQPTSVQCSVCGTMCDRNSIFCNTCGCRLK